MNAGFNDGAGLVAFRSVLPGGRKGFEVYHVSGRHIPNMEPVATIVGTDEAEALKLAAGVWVEMKAGKQGDL